MEVEWFKHRHPPWPVVAFGRGHKLEQCSDLYPVLNDAMLRLLLLQSNACDLFDIMPSRPSDIHCRLILRGGKGRRTVDGLKTRRGRAHFRGAKELDIENQNNTYFNL
jgi:hypothetical protein